jgi:hypothetical protein
MSFQLKRIEQVRIDNPEQAREVARRLEAMKATESEREDKVVRKEKIKAKMLGGELRPFDWAFGVVRGTGIKRRTNGQHSSEVFRDLTPEEWTRVKFPIFVNLAEYDCDTELDVAVLFEQFDPQWSTRNSEDLIGAHLGIHNGLQKQVDRHIANKVMDGLLWYANQVGKQRTHKDRKFHMIHESDAYREFLTWGGSFFDKKKTFDLLSEPVMAAVFHTISLRPTEADPFWREVAIGKLRSTDPDSITYKLAEYLKDLNDPDVDWPKAVSKTFTSKAQKRPTPYDTFATCLRAFHSTVNNRKIIEIFTHDKEKNAQEMANEYPITPKVKSA